MKVLIIGANGQLGWELQRTCPSGVEITALNSSELDITDSSSVGDVVSKISPEIIVNAAAFTAVDKAEQEYELAHKVNCHGVENIARVAKSSGAYLIHISTDFVFDGHKSRPYLPEDTPNPSGVYGKSKLAGEQALLAIAAENSAIIRTAWVYSSHGNNFVKTMLRLMSEREELGVVADQVGSPTWANGLANAVWKSAAKRLEGIFHWTDSGVASWYDFAMAILEEALALGLIKKSVNVRPIRTEDYPLPAKRPSYSVLDKTYFCEKTGMRPPYWRESLRKMLKEIKDA